MRGCQKKQENSWKGWLVLRCCNGRREKRCRVLGYCVRFPSYRARTRKQHSNVPQHFAYFCCFVHKFFENASKSLSESARALAPKKTTMVLSLLGKAAKMSTADNTVASQFSFRTRPVCSALFLTSFAEKKTKCRVFASVRFLLAHALQMDETADAETHVVLVWF